MDSIEIKYYSSKTGYVTEVISAQSTQGAINVIRARLPDAQINTVKQFPPADRRCGGNPK